MLKLITKAQAVWAAKDRGATAVEYGLMVALIAVAIIAVVGALGGGLDDLFGDVCTEIETAAAADVDCAG
jgi:pilus assembly protein Flp/PilA